MHNALKELNKIEDSFEVIMSYERGSNTKLMLPTKYKVTFRDQCIFESVNLDEKYLIGIVGSFLKGFNKGLSYFKH
jgi:hypothetical protein